MIKVYRLLLVYLLSFSFIYSDQAQLYKNFEAFLHTFRTDEQGNTGIIEKHIKKIKEKEIVVLKGAWITAQGVVHISTDLDYSFFEVYSECRDFFDCLQKAPASLFENSRRLIVYLEERNDYMEFLEMSYGEFLGTRNNCDGRVVRVTHSDLKPTQPQLSEKQ